MKLKRNLLALGLAGITLAGCSGEDVFRDYMYEGMINEEEVKCYISRHGGDEDLTLKVKKQDGEIVLYTDFVGEDLILDHVTVKRYNRWGEVETMKKYNRKTELGKEVLEVRQEEFDQYLKKIREINSEIGKSGLN